MIEHAGWGAAAAADWERPLGARSWPVHLGPNEIESRRVMESLAFCVSRRLSSGSGSSCLGSLRAGQAARLPSDAVGNWAATPLGSVGQCAMAHQADWHRQQWSSAPVDLAHWQPNAVAAQCSASRPLAAPPK